jgi:hypothetical protein
MGNSGYSIIFMLGVVILLMRQLENVNKIIKNSFRGFKQSEATKT